MTTSLRLTVLAALEYAPPFTLYSPPPVMLTGTATLMPDTVTELEITVVLIGIWLAAVNENVSGTPSLAPASCINVYVTPPINIVPVRAALVGLGSIVTVVAIGVPDPLVGDARNHDTAEVATQLQRL